MMANKLSFTKAKEYLIQRSESVAGVFVGLKKLLDEDVITEHMCAKIVKAISDYLYIKRSY